MDYLNLHILQSHYSVKSCASVGGLGTDNCVMVPSDLNGKMVPRELERLIIERKSKGQVEHSLYNI